MSKMTVALALQDLRINKSRARVFSRLESICSIPPRRRLKDVQLTFLVDGQDPSPSIGYVQVDIVGIPGLSLELQVWNRTGASWALHKIEISETSRAVDRLQQHFDRLRRSLPKRDFTLLLPSGLRQSIFEHVVPDDEIRCYWKEDDDHRDLCYGNRHACVVHQPHSFTEAFFMVSRRYKEDMLSVARRKATLIFPAATLGQQIGWGIANKLNAILDGQLLSNLRTVVLCVEKRVGPVYNVRRLHKASKIAAFRKLIQLVVGLRGTEAEGTPPPCLELR